MSKPNVTASEAAECLRILESAAVPIVAVEIAKGLQLTGTRETRRRHVRAIVKHLRDNCSSQIVATLQGGYWLTDDAALWRDYLEGRQIDAKRVLGRTHRQKKVLAESNGQGLLFGMRIRCGVASCGIG